MAPLQNVPVDFWQNDLSDTIELVCLMPNGMTIPHYTYATATIREIKEDLWKAAKDYPLYKHLKEQSMYVVSAISSFANIEEFNNESIRICDIQPYFCIIRIAEKAENTELSSDYEINKVIGILIGKCVDDFRELKNSEVNDFRYKTSLMGEKYENERHNMTWSDKLMYRNAPRLAKNAVMPESIRIRLRNENFVIVVKLENDETSFTFCVAYHITSHQLLELVLTKMARTMNQKGDRVNDFILKVFGRDEYLFGDNPLIQFMYIQEMLSNDGVPTVVMKFLHNLDIYNEYFGSNTNLCYKTNYENVCKNLSNCTLRKRSNSCSSWSKEDNCKLKVHSIEKINCDFERTTEISVHFGLFHGDRPLCAPHKIQKSINDDGTIEFNDEITFDIILQNVPRMAKLCVVIQELTRSSKTSNNKVKRVKDKDLYSNPLAWVNTTLFDFKNQLKTGLIKLYTWNYASDIVQCDGIFNSLGTIEQNPRTDECTTINLTFHNFGSDTPIQYPSEEIVLSHAIQLKSKSLNRDSAQDTRTINEILLPTLSNDGSYELHDQERNSIWAKRLDCLNDAPEALPFLLNCVEWNKRDEVSEICSLLAKWPKLAIERALELLDYAYPEPFVRRFAIKCLKDLRDEELLLYLLQLVQAIKHEAYLDCDLVIFLLERSFKNQRIGHYFFWHLRSEMQLPAMQIRFGLILEAYLKGSSSHMPLLHKQLECLEKLKHGSEIVKKGGKDKAKSILQDFLAKERNSGIFANLFNPLAPSFRCRGVKPDKCKVMDSKMRPLWIVFENSDCGDDIYIIFKNGDDLRQDMLTLQMLRVMDQLWKNEGHDFRMNIYGCISMEKKLGMIEVVLNAETIANIQKERGMFSATSPFKKGSLFSWLKEHNPTDEGLEKAIREFTLSCAGYCVATYVLGVGDRHSDNIMVKKNGQLFHIDFGHILGHFKEKFGVRRERVPFVLTHDFVYVINKGRTDREAQEFRTFQVLCETAFLILRKHGCLILSLFAMMISTGLPELSSEKDLNYLKETLVLDFSEEKARDHFRSKFSEALANSWKTSLNWASHNFSKNNKQ